MNHREANTVAMNITLAGHASRNTLANGLVSTRYQTQTVDANYVCIYDIVFKLNGNQTFDIGGTYTGTAPDFWFFFTTSSFNSQNQLLSLFVCHRKPGKFTIQISNSAEAKQKSLPDDNTVEMVYTLPKNLDTYPFKSSKPDEIHFIKSFSFGKHLEIPKECTLLIPIKITENPKYTLDSTIVKSVKLQHDLSGLLTMQEKTDLVLESATHKQFLTHKIVLAAHSPVLRNMIRNMKKLSSLFLDISDHDMELLLEFIYTGTMKNMMEQDCSKLLEIADKFQLRSLFLLTQHIIDAYINVENAIEMATIAKKYKLEEMQNKVFDFITKNPEVMKTRAYKDLQDVELAKYLIEFMQATRE